MCNQLNNIHYIPLFLHRLWSSQSINFLQAPRSSITHFAVTHEGSWEVSLDDGFVDILCRLIVQAVPQIELQEVIEKEGPLLEAGETEDDLTSPQPTRKVKDENKPAWAKGDFFETKKFTPLFRTELLVNEGDEAKKFYFSPSLNEYLGTMDVLLKIYITTVEKLPALTNSIPFLDPANLAGGAYSAVRGLVSANFF